MTEQECKNYGRGKKAESKGRPAKTNQQHKKGEEKKQKNSGGSREKRGKKDNDVKTG